MSLRSEMGFPTGNTKPTQIQGAKSISHPLSCSASSIPQLGQAQGYQHPSSPLEETIPTLFPIKQDERVCWWGEQLGHSWQTGELAACRRNVQPWELSSQGLSFPQTGDTGHWALHRCTASTRTLRQEQCRTEISSCFLKWSFDLLLHPFLSISVTYRQELFFSAVHSYKGQRHDSNPVLLSIYLELCSRYTEQYSHKVKHWFQTCPAHSIQNTVQVRFLHKRINNVLFHQFLPSCLCDPLFPGLRTIKKIRLIILLLAHSLSFCLTRRDSISNYFAQISTTKTSNKHRHWMKSCLA